MVINQKFFGADSIFSIITTVVMVFVSIFTAGSAICIAWTQRKNGKRKVENTGRKREYSGCPFHTLERNRCRLLLKPTVKSLVIGKE